MLEHVIREAAAEPAGAFVLVHGRGASEHDLAPLFDILDPDRRFVGIAPGGPLALPPGGRHWYAVPRVGHPDHDTFHASYDALGAFLDEQLAERGIGWERTVLGGFSQGAVMSHGLALGSGRPRPAGLLAMSGFIPAVDGFQVDLESRAGLPVLISHGTQDEVIDASFGEQAAERLVAAGLGVRTAFTPAGHHIDPRIVPGIAEWLDSVRVAVGTDGGP